MNLPEQIMKLCVEGQIGSRVKILLTENGLNFKVCIMVTSCKPWQTKESIVSCGHYKVKRSFWLNTARNSWELQEVKRMWRSVVSFYPSVYQICLCTTITQMCFPNSAGIDVNTWPENLTLIVDVQRVTRHECTSNPEQTQTCSQNCYFISPSDGQESIP